MESQHVSLSKHIYTNSHSKIQSHGGPCYRPHPHCHLTALFLYSSSVQEINQNVPFMSCHKQTQCFYVNSEKIIYTSPYKVPYIPKNNLMLSSNYCSSSEMSITTHAPALGRSTERAGGQEIYKIYCIQVSLYIIYIV